MKFLQFAILFSLFLVFSQGVNAQQLTEDEIVVIKGEKYIMHQVRTGETIFSISRDYKIERSLLIQNNPKIEKGLNIGDNLKIPYNENVTISQVPVFQKGDPTGFIFHTITSRNETPYFIAKKYGVTVEEIYAYNPTKRKFNKGIEIRIPVWNEKEIEKQEITEQNITEKKSEILAVDNITKEIPADNIVQGDGIASFFEHIIESGETMWGITQKYDVSESELIAINPLLQTGFPAGAVIKIPVKETSIVQIKPVNEDAFLKHEVEKGETLYGLASRYDLRISEIKKYNPALETRNLLRGEIVLIPQIIEPPVVGQLVDNQEEVAEQLAGKQEIIEEPVEVDSDFYKIELPAEVPVQVPESCLPVAYNRYSNETFKVALFLPLYIEANDNLNKKINIPETDSLKQTKLEVVNSDTVIEEAKREDMFMGFYKGSENFVQFYEGVLLAIDSMQNAGMKIKLNVFDTQQNADSIRKYIFSEEFLQTDLIIGPVYPDVQKEVSAISAKNRIPLVSPLSGQSNEIRSNSWFYQVNPDRDYIAAETAEMVAEEYFNSNFIVLKTSNYSGTPEGKLVDLIQEKLYNSGFLGRSNGVNFSIYDFQNDGAFGLRRILSKEKENVFYIPTTDEGELSVGISNINNLADEYSITLIGSSRFPLYESIQIDHFHNLKLEFISAYWTDYEIPSSINFIEKFKSNFYTEPNSFGMQGYDVTFYFLNALKNYGRDFQDCLPYMQVDLIQGNYNFEKVSQLGGYMNQGVSVISYKRNYDVVRKRVEGKLKLANK